jgi:hypothetical protein
LAVEQETVRAGAGAIRIGPASVAFDPENPFAVLIIMPNLPAGEDTGESGDRSFRHWTRTSSWDSPIDLPLKALILENATDKVRLTCNDPPGSQSGTNSPRPSLGPSMLWPLRSTPLQQKQ